MKRTIVFLATVMLILTACSDKQSKQNVLNGSIPADNVFNQINREEVKMLESKLAALLTNPRSIDFSAPFVYYIHIRDIAGRKGYRYVGRARNRDRLEEYKKNMRNIREGKPRRPPNEKRKGQEEYRAVHFVLYKALQENWAIHFYPLKSCASEHVDIHAEERRFIAELRCNLNDGRRWRIGDLASTTIEGLGIEPIDLKLRP